MKAFDDLAEQFRKFPGIGPRQAKRFVYYLLSQPPSVVANLLRGIEAVRESVAQCPDCLRYFQKRNGELHCRECSDSSRDTETLLVVEKDIDLENVERAGAYHGLYFVLGGMIPFLSEKLGPWIRIDPLLTRVNTLSKGGHLKEIILAFAVNSEGDHTIDILRERLEPLRQKFNFDITVLGRGLSTGTELEYSDADTLKNALRNRH